MGPQGSTIAAHDAEVTRRLRAAGAVIFGKLNMHEGALGGTTDNLHHGRTQNPWQLGLTPGGSSGGTGAAVAARLCAAGIGTDTLGSVRLPAAYCGVAGLKPTHRVVSARGVVPLSGRLDTVGPIARCVADLGLMFDVMAGFDPEYPGSVQRPGEATRVATEKADLTGVTCGIITNLDLVEMDADVRSTFARSIEMLEALGASIRRIDFADYDPTTARRAGLLVCEADGAAVHERAMTEWPGAFSPEFRRMLEYGRDAPRERLIKAERVIELAGFEVRRALGEVDLIVSPTTPQPAFPFDGPVPVSQADLTAIASFGGCPAVSLPCGLTRTGLPVGLQLIGRPSGERALLAAARSFEARCGFSATPPVSG
jgi:aspartyl-tRNA(Asn)/glutamyl-tRNA(Gln) amidotransferase subunit A